MKNQNTQQTEISFDKSKDGKNSPMISLTFLIIAFIVSWGTMSSCASSSRPSTQSEIEAQKELQAKLSAAQKEATQKWDSTLKADKKTN